MKRFNGGIVLLAGWLLVWFLQLLLPTQGLSLDPERISPKDLKTLLDKKDGDVVVVDVRDKGSYAAGHLPGAISIPEAEIQNRHQELPRDKTIVLYCGGPGANSL
jgi:predicted sulfurtransferase